MTVTAREHHIAAIELLDAGLSPVPTAGDGTKRPAGQWRELQHRLPSAAEVQAWFGNGSAAGIGLVLGPVSGGVEMLEFEGRFMAHYAEAVARLQAVGLGAAWASVEHGWREETPSGGVHFWWRSDAPEGNLKVARGADGLVTIETRGDGGFVVLAPTRGNFDPYTSPVEWRRTSGGPASIPTITADERQAILDTLATFDETPRKPISLAPRSPAQRTAEDGESPGDEYNRAHSWGDVLEEHGWTYVYTDGSDVSYWRRPGKTGGISASTNYGGADLLKVFTSNAYPLEPDKTYTRFGAYTALVHGGDFRAAAHELRPAAESPSKPRLTLPAPSSAPEDSDATRSNTEPAEPTGPRITMVRDLVEEDEPDYDWLIEGLLERMERALVVAIPGLGKSTFLRQIALRSALGEHPFTGEHLPRPVRALIVDAENSRRQMRRAFRGLQDTFGDASIPLGVVEWNGFSVLDERDVLTLHGLMSDFEPDILVIGPIYQIMSGDTNAEEFAKQAISHIDALRKAHECAVLMEAHAPYSPHGTKRHLRPQGSNVWEKWPEVGLTLDGDPSNRSGLIEVGRFRGDRDERSWPTLLRGGGEVWPFEMVSGGTSTVTWEHVKSLCASAGRKLAVSDLAAATGVGADVISGVIHEHWEEWEAMEDSGPSEWHSPMDEF